MKVTVCELPNESAALETAWKKLVEHVAKEKSEVVLLPEMPFYSWLANTKNVDPRKWEEAVQVHEKWIARLPELSPATVISTRPVVRNGKRHNQGYVWEPSTGRKDVHVKYYLPNDPGFWEATWYERGDGDFSIFETSRGKMGMLICTEIWFNFRAREYGKQGINLLVSPRSTPNPTADKWVAGGRAAAVVSGAYCLSSNLGGRTAEGGDFAGVGWIVEPEEGEVLGLTSAEQPFLTVDIDMERAEKAKKTYPRYVLD